MPDDEGPRYNPSEDREDMWGIQRQDRRWFQLLTLIGGTAGSIGLTWLELAQGPEGATLNAEIRNIILGVGGSFIAAGFVSWGLLHTKEMLMAIADWIRESTEKRRQRIREEALRERLPQAREEGRQQGREEMRQEMLAGLGGDIPEDIHWESRESSANSSPRDAYLAGYEDAQRSHPLASHDDAYVNGYGDAQRSNPLNPPDDESPN